MNNVKVIVAKKTHSVARAWTPAAVDNNLTLQFDIGNDQWKLVAVGFDKTFLNNTEERVLRFDKDTLEPVFNITTNANDVVIVGALTGIGQLKNDTGDIIITVVYTTGHTYYLVKKERAFFNFVVECVSSCMKDAVREMLRTNLTKGPRIFGMTASIVDQFWSKLFLAVCAESEIMEFSLKTKEGLPVLSRLYFDHGRPENSILSVGGWCYPFNLLDFPKRAIAEGTKSWLKEKTKKAEVALDLKGGIMIMKKTNEKKKVTSPS